MDAWWTANPDALIGCRPPPGVLILDVDPRHGGDRTFDVFHDILPSTRRHESGRGDGGTHWWFLRPAGPLTNRRLPGVDLIHHDLRYTILPPSPHPDTGRPYRWAASDQDTPVQPMPAALAHLIADTPPDQLPAPATRLDRLADGHTRPGDRFNAETDWSDLLGRHGWQLVGRRGEVDYWRRPGKTTGISATVNGLGTDRLHVFTSSAAPLEQDRSYDKLGAYAALEHGGDLPRAVDTLRARYGPASDTTVTLDGDSRRLSDTDDDQDRPPWLLQCVSWPELWQGDSDDEDRWLLRPVLLRGAGHALYAGAKTGKSLLVLEMVAALATGRPIFHHDGGPPVDVLYLDYEMTRDDLRDRLARMGYDGTDMPHLHYALGPTIPALDTDEGGAALEANAVHYGAQLVVVDTTGQSIDGDENEADTLRRFYQRTGRRLKRRGIALVRVDHAGKDMAKGQRGTSAKNDDVDAVWRLAGAGDRLTLTCTHQRSNLLPTELAIVRRQDPLSHSIPPEEYAAGTAEKAAELDGLGIPHEWGRDRVRRELVAKGLQPGRNDVLADAIRWRKRQAGLVAAGKAVGLERDNSGDSAATVPDKSATSTNDRGQVDPAGPGVGGDSSGSIKSRTVPTGPDSTAKPTIADL